MKKILIVFGYKNREYEYLCLLKRFLQKKGFLVKIRYMNFECYHEVFVWKPDFVILNQINQNENIDFAKFAKLCGIRICVLNAELLWSNERIKIKYAPDCNDYVDYTIEAGDKSKLEVIHKYSNLDENKIKMLGTPKLDIYLPIIKKNLHIASPYVHQIDRSKKTVCICSSFHPADLEWQKVKHNIVYQKIGEKNVNEFARLYTLTRAQYIQLGKDLVKQGRWNVIFRMHPLENPQFYIEQFRDTQNIIVDNTIRPSQLFKIADLIIHRSSTLALEAWTSDVKTISFNPVPNDLIPLDSFTNFEQVFFTKDALLKYFPRIMKNKIMAYKQHDRKKFLKQEFGFVKVSNISASEKIADFLATINIFPKKSIFHPYIIYYYILNSIRVICLKKYIYEIIGFIKGKEYMRIYKENYVYNDNT